MEQYRFATRSRGSGWLVPWCAAGLLLASCGGEGGPAEPTGYGPERLSDWGLFEVSEGEVRPVEGVVPYDVNAALWMDYSRKHRYIALPEGETISYSDDGVWQMPVGTIVIKAFGYPADARDPAMGERLIETRLLVKEEDGTWKSYVYVWNDAQTEAELAIAGKRVPVEWIDEEGEARSLTYRVPNANQCRGCHGGDDPVELIGPRTRQLDRAFDYGDGPVNQLDHFAELGMFDVTPPPAEERSRLADPFGDGDLDERARAYLDANCAHCHREGGAASSTALWLGYDVEDPLNLGMCRRPVAPGAATGGLRWDVVPGDPDSSIMVYRMESEDPEIKMPELPSQLVDEPGVALIREWIAAMEPVSCSM